MACKWFINREVGRYAVCTGAPILEGFKELPGPRNWALWLIVVPQVVVAISAIAGLASSSATAAVLVLPGPLWLWTVVIIGAAASIVLWGRYGLIEKTATVLGLALAVAAVVTAATVFPNPAALASGLVPQVPQNVDLREVLPWLGFALSGAAGIMWYSYWLPPKGYGVAGGDQVEDQNTPIDPKQLDEAGRKRICAPHVSPPLLRCCRPCSSPPSPRSTSTSWSPAARGRKEDLWPSGSRALWIAGLPGCQPADVLENIFAPLPSGLLMALGGFTAAQGQLSFARVGGRD